MRSSVSLDVNAQVGLYRFLLALAETAGVQIVRLDRALVAKVKRVVILGSFAGPSSMLIPFSIWFVGSQAVRSELDIRRMKGESTNMGAELKIDEIGYWSEIKLAILDEYAKPYNQILRNNKLKSIYIDGFAGAGHHRAKGSERVIEGSPQRALNVQPPFDRLHFVDIDGARVAQLKKISSDRLNVSVHQGDCNDILVHEVFPTISYAARERALCILDPYGLDLNWETIRTAGESKVIEIFLNFPVMDMNRNVLWRNSEHVSDLHRERMTKFWGDNSWESAAYQTTQGLFEEMQEKSSNEEIAEAFRIRLKEVGGFDYVPKPMPMRNSRGATVYYLFFAAKNSTADKIVKYIFAKYAHRGEVPNG
jgi:three-Cys-motif partner protein